ncbi:AAA family ATPase [Mollicutes bacterium LVI A0078]|nr:AAA family ATPase [Mollicutes bacterium LVI A0075]WOO91855.1 AAA family ATPase [Mollicutes bacterium LVI A0078]
MNYKVGAISGKFRLLHKAHKELMTRATLENIEELYIVVIDSPSIKRYSSLAELRIAIGNIMTDIDMKYTIVISDKEFDSVQELEQFVIDKAGHNNILMFDSKDKHQNVLLDNKFITCSASINISSSQIEANPYRIDNYENIAKEFMPYINKKVILSGTESTGKTQFCKKLSNIYNTTYSPEVGRFYAENELGFDDEAYTPKDFVFIAMEQMKQDKLLNMEAKRCLFVDTDPFVTLRFLYSYYEEYAERGLITPEFEKEYEDAITMLDTLCKTYKYDYVFLLTPDVPYVEDGIRWKQSQDVLNARFNELKEIYDKYSVEYHVIDKNSYLERFTEIELQLKDNLFHI